MPLRARDGGVVHLVGPSWDKKGKSEDQKGGQVAGSEGGRLLNFVARRRGGYNGKKRFVGGGFVVGPTC